MEYRQLGKSGLKVSPVCLGTAFRGFWDGNSDEANCIRVIERAVDLGVNFIDCANAYKQGECEEILGRALRKLGNKRDDLVVTSKVCSPIGDGPNDEGLSRFHIFREIERSLKRLQLDHIDLYLLHNFDPRTPLEETLRTMDDIVRQGKARYVGCCNWSVDQVVEGLWVGSKMGLDLLMCLQNQYNLLHRWEVEPRLFQRCHQFGLGLMTYSAVAVGLLTGQHRKGSIPPKGSFWNGRQEEFDRIMTEKVDSIIEKVIEIAGDNGKTPAQVSVAWILDHEEISSAMIGPDFPDQVDEIYGALDWTLSNQEREVLDVVSEPDWMQRYDSPLS